MHVVRTGVPNVWFGSLAKCGITLGVCQWEWLVVKTSQFIVDSLDVCALAANSIVGVLELATERGSPS